MLRILGSSKQMCDRVTRRDMLRVGGLGLAGLGLADFLKLREASAASSQHGPSFGKAKSVILIHLYGRSPVSWNGQI